MPPYTWESIDKTQVGKCSVSEQQRQPLRREYTRWNPVAPNMATRAWTVPPLALPSKVRDAVEAFCKAATSESAAAVERYVFVRVLATIINEAAMALNEDVANSANIDTAMKTGTNYPHGRLEPPRRRLRHHRSPPPLTRATVIIVHRCGGPVRVPVQNPLT